MVKNKPSLIPNSLRNRSKEFPYIGGSVDVYDELKEKDQQTINAETDETLALHQSEINALDSQNYVTVTADDQTAAVTDVLPEEGQKNTVYRVGNWDGTQYDPTVYSEYGWDAVNETYKLLDVKAYTLATAADFIEPDATKKAKIPNVGAVSEVYGHYEDNPEFVQVMLDAENRILLGIKANGTVYFGAGVPPQVAEYVSLQIAEITVDIADVKERVSAIEAFLADIDAETLLGYLNETYGEYTDSPEWVQVTVDSENKVLEGTKADGTKVIGGGLSVGDDTNVSGNVSVSGDVSVGAADINSIDSPEYLQITIDSENKIIEATKTDGTKIIGGNAEIRGNTKISKDTTILGDATILGKVDIQGATYTLQENPEWIKVLTDAHDKIIAGVMKDGSVYINNIIGVTDTIQELREAIEELSDDFYLVNPYKGVDFNNQVCAQSHEHCYNKSRLESAYNRGIRVIACSHYAPAVPRYPFSNFDRTYQDYKSKQAVLDGDFELVTRHCSGSVPTLDIDGTTVNTDDIPQIANAERPIIKDIGGHYNILGLLWGDPGHSLCNGELTNSPEDSAIKHEYTLESTSKFNELLEDESMWQFGSKYAFGTINHNTSSEGAITMLIRCPLIFKAMELFNQGYSAGWNDDFRSAYDNVLKAGYRIWGTAVVDWQNDWATWNFTTAEEKAEWEAKYNALSAEEQAEYGSAENYYMETGRYKFDRGTNVLLMDDSYDNLTAEQKAKDAIKAYIGGRYYMSGLNNYSMRLWTEGKVVTFKVSDIADKIIVITGKRRFEYSDVDSVELSAKADDMYIRFEAYWDDGDFVYSNPVWVNRVEN